MTSGRTIVLAPRLDDAKAWCLEHHVAPHGRNTVLCSTAESVHGVTFHSGDWLVIVNGCLLEDVAEMLYPALRTAPDYPEIATQIRDWFANEHHGVSQAPFEHVFGAAS